MIARILWLPVLTFLLSACALNGIFLAPQALHTTDEFTQYSESHADSLTLRFAADKTPLVYRSNGEAVDMPYTVKSHFFESESGNTIHAWEISPNSGPTKKLMYFLHGNAAHLVYQFRLATPFVSKGFTVFIIDYSGFGFSEGKATRKNVLKDGNAGLNYFLNLHPDHEELVIYGQSLGGHLSAVVALQHEGMYDALVMEGAFSSHKDIAGHHVPVMGWLFTREMYSAKKSLKELQGPVMIVHSTEDQVIPYAHGLKLYEAARGPKQLYTIDKAHIRGPLYYLDSIQARIDGMLAK